jgi:hypothetical protein
MNDTNERVSSSSLLPRPSDACFPIFLVFIEAVIYWKTVNNGHLFGIISIGSNAANALPSVDAKARRRQVRAAGTNRR